MRQEGERDIMGTMGTATGLAPYVSGIGIPYAPRMSHLPQEYLSGASGINGAIKGTMGTRTGENETAHKWLKWRLSPGNEFESKN